VGRPSPLYCAQRVVSQYLLFAHLRLLSDVSNRRKVDGETTVLDASIGRIPPIRSSPVERPQTPAPILRLIAKLGFDSYPDFQQALRDELELRLQTPLAKAPSESGHPRQGDFLSTYTRAIIENIEASVADLPRAEFEAAVTLLADPRRRILLLGGRFTSSLAIHLYLHLRELRPRVQLVEGQTATWAEHLLDLGRNDVLVVFDIRRFQEDVVLFAREAAAGGTHVLLFTDTWVSPVAAVADHVFSVRTTMPSSWESFAALSALSEALIARLHAQHWKDSKRRMEKLELLRAHLSDEESRP
jgi:DNA-binding MurR/RpiR family transcriptional regulator